jgi:hypothetical protein
MWAFFKRTIMKNKFLILVLIISYSTIQAAPPMVPATNTYLISNGTMPLKLNQPGNYFVVENILYGPSGTTPAPALTVATSNVSINLLGFTLQQTGGLLSVTGIQVDAGLTGISITNGSIVNFTASAISVASGCSQITVNNITVTGCGQRGIEFIGAVGSVIALSTITNSAVFGTCTVAIADNAITLSNCTDMQLNNVLSQEP